MAVHFGREEGFSTGIVQDDGGIIQTFPFSYACWFDAEQFNVNRRLMGQGGPDYVEHATLFLSGGITQGKVWAQVEGGGSFFSETTDQFTFGSGGGGQSGTWYHAGVAFGGSGGTCTSITPYLNGVAGPTVTGSATPNLSRITIIGGVPADTSSYGYRGCMAKDAFFNTLLSPEQFLQLYEGASAQSVAPDNVVAYLKLLDEPTAETDSIGGFTWIRFESGEGLTTCINAPTGSGGSSSVRIMG